MATPVVMIGLDGATFRWLEPLAAEGYLPNLGALLDGGSAAPLVSTMPPLTPPGWATCLTGVSPRQHGLWDFVRRRSSHSYDLLPTSGQDVRAPWLWARLDRRERRSVVLNLPFSFPARPLHGLQVCGFDTTDRKRASYPEALLEELEVGLAGPYPFFYQVPARHIRKLFPNADDAIRIGDESSSTLEAVVAESRRFTRDKLRAAAILASREPFDFLFVHIFETDHLSHEAWGPIEDPEHPDRPLLLEYFRTLDDGVGALVEACYRWEEPVVLLVSDHGFGRCDRRLLLNDWLVREGLLVLRDAARPRQPEPAGWDRIDWRRSQAYAIQTGIHLNTRAWHPEGIVSDLEADALMVHLETRLRETLGDDGHALRVERRFPGTLYQREGLAPDLVVHVDAPVCAMGYGGMQGAVWADAGGLTGYHRMDGIFVASGKGVRAGRKLEPVRMVDVAPTVLQLLEVDERAGLEGRVLWEIFENAFTTGAVQYACADSARTGVRLEPPAWAASSPSEEPDLENPADLEEIKRRLAALGYMG